MSIFPLFESYFVATKGSCRYYIQSAFMLPDEQKQQQEERSLLRVDDSFKKIIVMRDNIILHRDDNGLVTMGLTPTVPSRREQP